jgi:ribose 5-phosphate isomerase B
MSIFIASDHAGFALKETLVQYLREQGKQVEDLGPHEYNEGDDYPDTIAPLAHAVAGEKGSSGIAIGGSGQGEAMVCNRVPGVRAAVYYGFSSHSEQTGLDIVALARSHNDANVLSLGSRFITEEEAKEAVSVFLETPASTDERHVRRVAKLG